MTNRENPRQSYEHKSVAKERAQRYEIKGVSMSETESEQLFDGARRAEQYDEGTDAEPNSPVATMTSRKQADSVGEEIDLKTEIAPRTALSGSASTTEGHATWGKRGLANRFGFRFRPAQAELEHLDKVRVIRQATWTRPVRVLVANPKSSLKTPTAIILGGQLASIRGGMVVTWEVSDEIGSLTRRAEGEPGRGLYELLQDAENVTNAGILGGYTQPQTSHLDVIGSVRDRPALDAQGVRTIAGILDRDYRICIMDSGSNSLHSDAFSAAVDLADVVVIPVLWSVVDTAHAALDLLDSLEGSASPHRRDLATRVIIVTSHDGRPENPEVVVRISEAIEACPHRERFDVPFDPHIALGEQITLSSLHAGSKRAWIRCAAEVIRTLQESVQ